MKVSFYRNPAYGGLSIMIWEKRNGKTYAVKPVSFEMQEVKEGYVNYKPSIHLDYELSDEFLRAFAEELDQHGVKTDSDAKIAGTLEATREHLKDLQRIVFKEKEGSNA